MRPSHTLLAGYLTLTLVPLLGSRPDAVGIAVAAAHLAAAWILLRHARRAPRDTLVPMDWLPLALVPLVYLELPLLNQWLVEGYLDPTVQRWEEALLGGDPSRSWAAAMPRVWLSEPLHAAYLAYYPLIYLPQLPHFLRGRARAFQATALAVMIALLACYLAFVVFPVQGPRYLGAPRGIPDGPFRALTLAVLENGSSRGAAFPSAHVSVAVAQALLALRFHGRWGWGLLVLAVLLGAGAVYGGFHYGVDALAGALVGVLAAGAALAVVREAEGARSAEGAR